MAATSRPHTATRRSPAHTASSTTTSSPTSSTPKARASTTSIRIRCRVGISERSSRDIVAFRLRLRHYNTWTGVSTDWWFNGAPVLPPDPNQYAHQNNFLASGDVHRRADPGSWQHQFRGFEYQPLCVECESCGRSRPSVRHCVSQPDEVQRGGIFATRESGRRAVGRRPASATRSRTRTDTSTAFLAPWTSPNLAQRTACGATLPVWTGIAVVETPVAACGRGLREQ